jgi:two-component system cell cycle response regulator
MSQGFDKSKVKILVVDDEASIREMLCLALKEDGWDVHSAENGKLALDRLGKESFHIVLSDINMPEMLGTDLLKAVKESYPHIEFIIMTSQATLDSALTAIKHGAYDYLHKPFDSLDNVCRKMTQVSEGIFLRQQNSELLKRLRIASHDLKRLVEAIAPLSGVLKLDDFKKMACESLEVLFPQAGTKWMWWTSAENSWSVYRSSSGLETAPAQSIDEIKAQHLNWDKPQSLSFEAEGVQEYFCFEATKEPLAKVYSQQLQTCFQKVSTHLELEALANRDGLTRLFNHRYFQERLRQEISQATRQKADLSFILLDVDHFKHYNDTHGHPAGDKLLKQMAKLLDSQDPSDENRGQAMRRVTDIVARYGGEEFVVILPFTNLEGALIKAERLREAIANFPFDFASEQPMGRMSVSVGVASFPIHAESPEDLIRLADEALYRAKKAGRNQVMAASVEPVAEEKESSESLQKSGSLSSTLGALLEPTGEQAPPSTPEGELPSRDEATVEEKPPVEEQPLPQLKKHSADDGDIEDLLGAIEKACDHVDPIAKAEDYAGVEADTKKGISQ